MSEEYQTRLRELLTPRQQDLWERLSSCVEERYDMDILWNKGFGSCDPAFDDQEKAKPQVRKGCVEIASRLWYDGKKAAQAADLIRKKAIIHGTYGE